MTCSEMFRAKKFGAKRIKRIVSTSPLKYLPIEGIRYADLLVLAVWTSP